MVPPTSVEWCQVASILTRVITTHRQASWRWRHLHDTHSTSALKRKRAFKLWVLLGTEKSSYLLGTANFHQFSTYRYIIKNGRILVDAVADLHRGKFIQWRLVGRLSDLSWCPVPDVCRCQSVAERKAGNTDEGWNMDVQTLQKKSEILDISLVISAIWVNLSIKLQSRLTCQYPLGPPVRKSQTAGSGMPGLNYSSWWLWCCCFSVFVEDDDDDDDSEDNGIVLVFSIITINLGWW